MPIGNITTNDNIKAFRAIFCRWGICPIIVSDNGLQFKSDQMSEFMRRNGICHVRTATYFPASNGLAKNSVCFKKFICFLLSEQELVASSCVLDYYFIFV